MVIWITGLSGAGKSTIAQRLVDRLTKGGRLPILLDGDGVREVIADLETGHDRDSRLRNAYRICRLARMLEAQGHVVICATMSLFHEVHEWNRRNLDRYFEVYLKVDMETLRQRDPKGLYQRVALEEEKHVVGVDLTIEEPKDAHLVIDNGGPHATVAAAVEKILEAADLLGESKDLKLAKHATLHNKVVFVDGVGHAGKVLVGPILSTYKHVEIQKHESVYEYIGTMYHLGKIELDAAVALIKIHLDQSLYHSMLGRGVNFRPTDASSIFVGMNHTRYLQRLLNPEGEPAVDEIRSNNVTSQNTTHELLAHITPFFEAFGRKLFIVEVMRHPRDLVNSWIRRGWGGDRMATDPRSFILSFDYQGRQLPYFARDFADRYYSMEPAERVIHCLHAIQEQIMGTYQSLAEAERRQILFMKFEEIVTDPLVEFERMASFIGLEQGEHFEAVLREQRCPRVIDTDIREEEAKTNMKNTPQSALDLLARMSETYEAFDPRATQ